MSRQINCYRLEPKSYPRYVYSRKSKTEIMQRYHKRLKFALVSDTKVDEIRLIFCPCISSKSENFPTVEDALINKTDQFRTKTIKVDSKNSLRNILTKYSYSNKKTKFSERKKVFLITNEPLEQISTPEAFPGFVIFIAKNEDPVSNNMKYHSKIHVCQSDNLGQTICDLLERSSLEVLRILCENFDRALGISQGEQSLQESSLEKSNTYHDLKQPPKKLETRSWSFDAKEEERKQEEKMIKIVKEDKECVERFVYEILGIFNRSHVPKENHPEVRSTWDRNVSEELLAVLQKISPSIRSCGFRFQTLQLYVTNDIEDHIRQKIKDTLQRHGISDFSIVSAEIKPFYSVGADIKVKSRKGKFVGGSLGGFARTESDDKMWMLMSRHVARCNSDGKVYLQGKPVADIMKQEEEEEKEKEKEYLDIAAACFSSEDDKKKCETRFITESKKSVPGRLFEYDASKLRGLPVHIKGTSTPLGLGTITMPDLKSVDQNETDDCIIFVENRNSASFAKEGDSGAIVCADSIDKLDEEVQLISMVIGESIEQKGHFATVRLDKGLEELKKINEKTFDIL